MSNPNAIEAKAKEAVEENGIFYARMEYYMEANPQQKQWRLVPGVVIGTSKEDAQSKAEGIAQELSELDIQELMPAVKKLVASQQMVSKLKDAKSN